MTDSPTRRKKASPAARKGAGKGAKKPAPKSAAAGPQESLDLTEDREPAAEAPPPPAPDSVEAAEPTEAEPAAEMEAETAAGQRGRTTNLVIAALGGEGGGVLAEWVTRAATLENFVSQATSVPGVAQRTGATIYYIEMFDRDEANGQMPVMSLFPMTGDIDIVLASEALEAARMVQRGFVTPDRTTLISSDSRSFAIAEKAQPGDGVTDHEQIMESIRLASKRLLHFDMQEITQRNDTVISATMLGALAGSGALPFRRSAWTQAIRESGGRGVKASLSAFRDSYERAAKPPTRQAEAAEPAPFALPEGTTEGGKALLKHIREHFPAPTHEILHQGIVRLSDYQDHAYAADYLSRLAEILPLDKDDPEYRLTRETGRFLALWMAFEDIVRVAQLKIRAERTERIRREVRAEEGQPIAVNEYLRPQARELVSFLPPWLARFLLNSKFSSRFLNLFTGGRVVRTTGVFGFMTFYLLGLLRPFRRRSWIYAEETARIDRWLKAIRMAAAENRELGLQLALCGRLIKGYSKTRERGFEHVEQILNLVERSSIPAETLAELRQAALADDSGAAFAAALAQIKPEPRRVH